MHEIVSRKNKLEETSPRTLLRRLEAKGYLTDGRAHVYHAVERARSIAACAVRQIIDRFCRGSVEELVSGMVEAKAFTETEMEQLEKRPQPQIEAHLTATVHRSSIAGGKANEANISRDRKMGDN